MNQNKPHEYDVVFVGNARVGKSSFIEEWRDHKFRKEYRPSLGWGVYSLSFETNHGEILLGVSEVAGTGKTDYYSKFCAKSDACVIMFAKDDEHSYNDLEKWADKYHSVEGCQNKPIMLIGNKDDIRYPHLSPIRVPWDGESRFIGYFEHSVQSRRSDKIWQALLRQLTGYNDLIIKERDY